MKAAIGRAFKLNPKTISAGVIRDVRKKLGIDRPGRDRIREGAAGQESRPRGEEGHRGGRHAVRRPPRRAGRLAPASRGLGAGARRGGRAPCADGDARRRWPARPGTCRERPPRRGARSPISVTYQGAAGPGGPRGASSVRSRGIEGGDWLGGRDSNPDSQIQSLESYRWTTPQYGGRRIMRGRRAAVKRRAARSDRAVQSRPPEDRLSEHHRERDAETSARTSPISTLRPGTKDW